LRLALGFISVIVGTVALGSELAQAQSRSGGYSIIDAIKQAVHSHPGVSEAAANRRATEAELRQQQGTLLPQVRLQAEYGPEKLTRHDIVPPPPGDGQWKKDAREGSIIVRQLLFDGFSSLNEIWRQSARVDAAAARVHERTELIALDAAEAYIDVVRYRRLVQLAEENVGALRSIAADVKRRFDGGRSGEGDYQQSIERLTGAEATLSEFRLRLDEAYAKYRRAVGLEPNTLIFPARLRGLPHSKDDSLAVTLRHNPTLRAAGADAIAAKYGFRATAGSFMPTISLEGRAAKGIDRDNILGESEDISGKVVLSWDIFRGGQDSWRRAEMADRLIEQTQRHARLQRDAFESLDKAWAARTVTSDRIVSLTRQSEAARRVIDSYSKEYELGQRTLIDLLDARNQYFNTLVSIVSTRAVAVFADFQLLATMGHLLEYIKTAPPPEADPLAVRPFGLFPYKLPPVILKDPDIGPEPLNVREGWIAPEAVPQPTKSAAISQRWPVATALSFPSLWRGGVSGESSVIAKRWVEPNVSSAFASVSSAFASHPWKAVGPFNRD
jgi:adhesin transport system outer membrane protein